MARCQGIKRDGGRCTLSVPPGVQWCFNHDPALAPERRRNASRAGKSAGGAADLEDMLPANTPLHYDYEGARQRQELADARFTIAKQQLSRGQSTIVISSTGPPFQ